MSTYRSLSGSSYIELPAELRSSKKGLINIKHNDQKCFLWYHVRHKKVLARLKKRTTFGLTCFVMKTN